MRFFFFAVALAGMVGCASISPPVEVAKLRSALPLQETVVLLNDMAYKCWSTNVNPLKDGIRIDSYAISPRGPFIVSGRRINWGIGLAKEPFIVLTIAESNSETTVSIHEGDFGKGLTGRFRLDAATHVPGWLNGDRECKPFATTLWHS